MYIPPILLSERQIENEIIKQTDDEIVCEVRHQLMIDIDKDELVKALMYDRDSYDKGVKDGEMRLLSILKNRITTYREDIQYKHPDHSVTLIEANTLDLILRILDEVEESEGLK